MATSHQSTFPTRQVHLVSTAGIPTLSGETKADLTFFFNTPIVYIPSSYDCLLSCVSASIPYVWSNIASTNNTFSVQIGGVTHTSTLQAGSYGVDSIINILGTKNPTLTFTYNQNTHTINITHATSDFTLTDTSLSAYLGFTNMGSTAFSLDSTVPVNMIKTTSVFVETPDLLSESFDSRLHGQSGVVCRIPIAGTPGSLLSWTNVFGTQTKLALKQINHVRVRLLDDRREVLDMRGYTWTVTLQFAVAESIPFVEGEWLESSRSTR